jgi:hypothetical protein
MSTIESSIKIVRNEGKLVSFAVIMPIEVDESTDGNFRIYMPLFYSEAVAKDESDVEKAVEEFVIDYCRDAEESGPGIETELQELGWVIIDDKANESAFEFYIKDVVALLDPLLIYKMRSFNKNLELT